MPNWVSHQLLVYGNNRDLQNFERFITTTEKIEGGKQQRFLDFNLFVARPAKEDDNWYNWNCDNWGTKWNSQGVEIDDSQEDVLRIQFDTAWNRISDKLWEAIKSKFPQLEFDVEADEEAGFFHSDTEEGRIVDRQGEREF